MPIIDITRTLVIDEKVREWCRLPYPGHPNGCPNWNRRAGCPPAAPHVSDLFDLSKQHWFAGIVFDLAEHRKNMLAKHPGWSLKQANCCLYWQNGVRKNLSLLCKDFQKKVNGLVYNLVPEALGVNVFRTVRRHGIKIKPNPKDIIYKIALIGYPVYSKILF